MALDSRKPIINTMNNNNKPTGGTSFYNIGPAYNNLSNPQAATITKYSTLSPYLAEIQKRKKAKSVLNKERELYRKNLNHTGKRKRQAQSKHESSSKSFRIKEKSSTSLHLHLHGRENSTIINIIGKLQSKDSQPPADEDTLKNNIKNNNTRAHKFEGPLYSEKQISQGSKARQISQSKREILNQPHSSHTIRLESQHSRSKHKKINENSSKRIVISRNSQPNTINMNYQTLEKREKKIYPSNVRDVSEKMGKKDKSFRKGMYETQHTFQIDQHRDQAKKVIPIQDNRQQEQQFIIQNRQQCQGLSKPKANQHKKLNFPANNNPEPSNRNQNKVEINKHGYTIDSYRNKNKGNFYGKDRGHGRCDSALEIDQAEISPIEPITKTTELKDLNKANTGNPKKFRKNKYEQMYSSVTSNEIEQEQGQNFRAAFSTNGVAVKPNHSVTSSGKTEPKITNSSKPDFHPAHHQVNKSDSRTVKVGKGESANSSSILEMDLQAQKEIKKFYWNMGSKHLQHSLEKSMERYFAEQRQFEKAKTLRVSNQNPNHSLNINKEFWIPKTNNDIEIYLSTMQAPIKHQKQQATTEETSKMENKVSTNNQNTCLLEYDFDYVETLLLVNNSSHNKNNKKRIIKDQGATIDIHEHSQNNSNLNNQHSEISEGDQQSFSSQEHRNRVNKILENYLQNTSEKMEDNQNQNQNEEQLELEYDYQVEFEEQGSFQKQRKEVEKQYFYKQGPPNIEWSDDDCQIDDST